nr:retrotransposon protein, putative, unclassified [Tanacetum cinerariifolium]
MMTKKKTLHSNNIWDKHMNLSERLSSRGVFEQNFDRREVGMFYLIGVLHIFLNLFLKPGGLVNSSAEAEYVALSASCAKVMWMRTPLKDYGFSYNKIPLYYDSQLAIAISCIPVQHSCTKHIHTRFHFIKEHVENSIIELYFVRTEYQLANIFTKALPKDRFQYLVRRIGMRCLTPVELEVLTNESA